jgi:hypothetical protein
MPFQVPSLVEWPSDLPVPLESFSGEPLYGNSYTDVKSEALYRVNRFKKVYYRLSVSWIFTDEQFSTFQNFFDNDLFNGTSVFKIELRFPKNSELKSWAVRFLGGYEAELQDKGIWKVRADLLLLHEQ